MTIINIISATIYTRRVDPKSLLLSWNIVLIFLVLLYIMLSGLVLYWIANNIFALVKNMILAKRLPSNEKQESTYNIIKSKLAVFIANDDKVVKTVIMLWLFALYLLLLFLAIPEGRLVGIVPNTILGIAITVLVISGIILLLSYCNTVKDSIFKRITVIFLFVLVSLV